MEQEISDPVLNQALREYTDWGIPNVNSLERGQFPNRLYHYTDGLGLFGILETSSIRLTDYRHLNDPSEIQHGVEITESLIGSLASDVKWPSLCLLAVLRHMISPIILSRTWGIFIASFSEDSDELGQWRAYSDNGRGFSIGFSQDVFKNFSWSDGNFSVRYSGQVYYNRDVIVDRHRAAIEKACSIVEDVAERHPQLVYGSDNLKSIYFDKLVNLNTFGAHLANKNKFEWIIFLKTMCFNVGLAPIMWNCLTSKHPSYTHEREYRIAVFGSESDDKNTIQVRLRGRSEIISYIQIPLPVKLVEAIAEIVVGPSSPLDTERNLQRKLRSLGGGDIPIRRSTIPYRSS
jgi:Protein of unknown function (DUF2971)